MEPSPSEAGRPEPRRLSVLSLLLLVSAGGLCVQSIFLIALHSTTQVGINLIFQLATVVLVGSWGRRRTGTYLSPIFLFVAAIYFWHTPFLTGYFFQLSPIFEYTGNIFTYGEAFVYTATGLVGMCIGMATLGAFIAQAQRPLRPSPTTSHRGGSVSVGFAWSCFGIFTAITVLYLKSAGQTLQGDYFSQYVSDQPETTLYRLFNATKFFGVLVILLLFQAATNRRQWILASCGTLGLIFALLMFGSRSMPFIYALTLVVCVDTYVKRLPLWILAGLGVAGSAASFVVDQTRELGIGMQIFDFGRTGVPLNLLQIFWDAGGVLKTVLRTMEFSAHSGLLWGQSFSDAIVSMVPTPILSSLAITRNFVRPSVWLVENSGDLAPGAGLGYSLVAESYLNFGLFGILVFFVIGWFLSRAYRAGQRDRQSFGHLYALNLSILLTLHMRNDVATYLRVVLWGFVVVALVNRFGPTRIDSKVQLPRGTLSEA